MRRHQSSRLYGGVLAVVAGTVLALPTCPTAPASAAQASATPSDSSFVYQGDAYGTFARVGSTVTSGKSAPITLGCTAAAGIDTSNSAAGLNLPPLITTGAVTSTGSTATSPTTSSTSSQVADLGLLAGLVTADAVVSSSSTSHDSDGFSTSAAGTAFVSLEVAGIPIGGDVAPNTKIDLVGFGSVTLNEQQAKIHHRDASLVVNALHVVIDEANVLGIPVGTNVVVAHARSALSGPVAATVDGFGYGTRLHAAGVLSLGASFRVSMPCDGTGGKVKQSSGAGISLPGILDTGVITDTVQGKVKSGQASSESTSTVADASILGDLVDAGAIHADAHASTKSGGSLSDDGSSFATLEVAGFPEIGPGTPANTKLSIDGIGTLWIHRVIKHSSSIEVRMLELVIKHDNVLGLPIGSDLSVGVAHASVHA